MNPVPMGSSWYDGGDQEFATVADLAAMP